MRIIKIINRKGQVIILVTLAVVLLLLLVGLALDSGIGYAVKAKLNSAVDAAAIAAGRAISGGDTTAATAAANKFFQANFPAGYLRARVTSGPNTDVTVDTNGRWHITVTASAEVPTYFLRIRGNNAYTASARAEAVKRDLDMAFVIDTTDSMQAVATQVKSSAVQFVNMFDASSDRMALVHFAYGAFVDDPIRTSARGFDKSSVTSHINNLNYPLGGFTNFSEPFWHARTQLNSVMSRSSLRAIVFFTDGSPNSLSSTFTFPSFPLAQRYHTGVIQTSQAATGSPEGLWEVGQQNQPSPSPWHPSNILSSISPTLPQYFNCTPGNTNPNADTEFPIWPHAAVGVRNALPANASATYANINRASRNLPEDMAKKARQNGIYVFTLGLGSHLREATGSDGEHGEMVLKRMANDPSADTYNSGELQGLYCYAADTSQLNACYDAIASMIFRLTK
jgi:Flp pilus assembly protein TadG